MRIRRLHLLRYGHFTDAAVDLPASTPDVQLIFGPNEAGKSTAMSAIEDLLYGIPGNSSRNFLHEYGAMRLGATLEREGSAQVVRRRKGKKDTLLADDETPLPAGESVLTPFLGGADRPFYMRMFNLDHERLRQGGREILEARDDVGQMLFSAGTGVVGLRDRQKKMEAEADALWASRRAAHRKYYQAEDKLRAAETALRDHVVTANKWQESKSAYENTAETQRHIEQQIEAMTSELQKLSRIRRVCRNVRRRLELVPLIDGMHDVKLLPEDASEQVAKAAKNDAHAAASVTTLTEQIDALKTAIDKLIFDENLLLRADDIKRLNERRIQVQSGKTDLPKRRAELDAATATLTALAGELGWNTENTDSVIEIIPTRAKIASIRALLNTRGGASVSVEKARTAVQEAEEGLAELSAAMEMAETGADVTKLSAVIKAIRASGDLENKTVNAIRDVSETKAAAQRQLEQLIPKVSDIAALRAMILPPPSDVQMHRDDSHSLQQRLDACREKIHAADQELAQHTKTYEQILSDEHLILVDDLLHIQTIEGLHAAAEQSNRLRNLTIELEKLDTTLFQDGDGFSIAELSDECRTVDPDQIAAREQTVAQELQELRDRHLMARDLCQAAQVAFEAIGGDDRAARDAADRQSALSELRDIAERYIRIRSESMLLQWAIDRYRREKQAPLLKRAGELFAVLTGGAFLTLQLEFDDNDTAHLAGMRSNGKVVQVPGMSSGTADQLYLALRIAAVEDYLDRAEPLPFVADDLFINFDDERAQAGFRVLGELAKKTQVLFFTHHQHLIDVAKSVLGSSASQIPLPEQKPSALSA
jgi:uncharacterized protein YhaN